MYMAWGVTSFQWCKKKKNEFPNANILVCPNVCGSFLFLGTFMQIDVFCLFETLFLTVD